MATATSQIVWTSAAFTEFAVNADTLYPALFAEEIRSDIKALASFRPSRIPSYLPDLFIFVLIDLAVWSWRIAWWMYGAIAICIMATLGGYIASLALGQRTAPTIAVFTILICLALLVGVAHYEHFANYQQLNMFEPRLPVNIHLMLLTPVFQSGAFIAGLAVIALAWQTANSPRLAMVTGLTVLTAMSVASNLILVAHAVLPAVLGLILAVRRNHLREDGRYLALSALAVGAICGVALGEMAGREELPFITPSQFGSNALHAVRELPNQPTVLLAILASLPMAVAYLRMSVIERRFALRVPGAFRFFLTASCAAVCAGLLLVLPQYYIPLSWRYAAPLAWWPLIWLAGVLVSCFAARIRQRTITFSAGAAIIACVATSGSLRPAIFSWVPSLAACLDELDPDTRLDAGLADYWNARLLSAASDWRRQVAQLNGDGSAALYINNPEEFLQRRHAPAGLSPSFRFIVMQRLEQLPIRAAYGPPDREYFCGQDILWIFETPIDVKAILAVSPALVDFTFRRN